VRRAAAIAALSLTPAACVERTLHITSDPPGALVWLNGVEVGVTPVDVAFTWYGVYDVQVEKDGYEPLLTRARAAAPVWEAPGLDFFAEALPGRRRSAVRWHFPLTPAADDPDAVIERARRMRDEAFPVEPIEPGAPPG